MAHTRRSWEYLAELDPDIALLQEANPSLAPALVRERWPDWVMWPVDTWGWGSAILAKPALELSPYPGGPDGMEIQGWIATGSIRLADGESAIVGSVHAPPFRITEQFLGRHNPDAIRLPRYRVPRTFDIAYATLLERVRGRRFIAGGDWNISRDLWRVYHPESRDIDFFDRAAADGWVDCYRRDHKHEGQTWFRAGNLGYQFDHVFCDEVTSASMRSCEIDAHPASCLRMSDHAPLTLRFDD